MTASLQEIADAVVKANQTGEMDPLFRDYYSPEIVSVEPFAMEGAPEESRFARGMPALKEKHARWEAMAQMHEATTKGPYLHPENQFSVIYEMDVTFKESGERMQMDEVGLYTVKDGKVVKEEFFYQPSK